MNVNNIGLIVLILAGLMACSAQSNQKQRGPECIGPVCLYGNEARWKDAEPFFKKYGVGVERKGKFPAYWYVENGVYVYIGRYHGENKPIDTIVVSKYPYYSRHVLPPKESFGTLATNNGIKLGDSYAQVIAMYGDPDNTNTEIQSNDLEIPDEWSVDPKGLTICRYQNTHGEFDTDPWSLFIFENDVLIAIQMSNAL